MRFFLRFSSFSLLFLFLTLLCACNVPEALPTATMTPDWTATPIPPTATPTPVPSATATPVPEYLEVREEDLSGIKLILSFDRNGKVSTVLEELVHQFNENNPQGITIETKACHSAEELEEQIKENHSHLVIADSAWMRSLDAERSLFVDLTAFLADQNLSLNSETVEPLMDVMLETENNQGSFQALPLWAAPAFLFYNKTWAIELGFPDSPADLASFAEQACAAGKANYSDKDDGKHGTGGWIVSSAPEDVLSWMLTFTQNGETPGELIRSDAGNVFEDTASWLRNLFDNGCAWNSRVKEPYDYFANRYALFYSGTYSDAERQYNAFEQSEEHGFDNWDLLIYPTRSTGNGSLPHIYADIVSIAVSNNADAKSTNAAWHFIRWLYSEEHAAELALAALAWPVQDNEAITKLYRGSGEDKLYQTLSYRQYLVNNEADGNWLTDQMILSDGFNYIFNPSAKPEDIPGIWEQIGSLIAEIHSVNNLSENSVPESNIEGVNNETQS